MRSRKHFDRQQHAHDSPQYLSSLATDLLHYTLPDQFEFSRAKVTAFDCIRLGILHLPKLLCNQLSRAGCAITMTFHVQRIFRNSSQVACEYYPRQFLSRKSLLAPAGSFRTLIEMSRRSSCQQCYDHYQITLPTANKTLLVARRSRTVLRTLDAKIRHQITKSATEERATVSVPDPDP